MELKLKYVHVYCFIQNSLFSVLISHPWVMQKLEDYFFPYVIYSNKNVKKYGSSYQELVGFELIP